MKLTKSKNRMLSTLCGNFSEVFFISLVIPIFTGFDTGKIPVVIFGILATIAFSWLALIFAERGKV